MSIALTNPTRSPPESVKLALDMVKYMHHINSLNANDSDWLYYDEVFRSSMVNQETPFGSVDYALVMEAANRGRSAKQIFSTTHKFLRALF